VKHSVAVIPGGGIGKEVVPEAVRVLERTGQTWCFGFEWSWFDWGCERFLDTGTMMPDDGLDRLHLRRPASTPPLGHSSRAAELKEHRTPKRPIKTINTE
jgi:isocitrate/isopropylmalate dehydrogenase